MKILLVDDSKSARYALRLQLQRYGITVETCDAAEPALERAREDPPDAIFMDHTMPGMNGFEALDILQATPSTAHIPVVMCTSNEDPDFIAQAQKKGAYSVLSKSTAGDKLQDLLDKLQHMVSAPEGVAAAVPATGAAAQPSATVSNFEQIDEHVRNLVSSIFEEHAQRLTTDLMARIDERIQTRVRTSIEPHMDDLGESLTNDLLAKTDERLAKSLEKESERLQQQFLKAQNEHAQVTMNRLLNESLPQLLRQQFKQEKQELTKTVQELINKSSENLAETLVEKPDFVSNISQAVEATLSGNAERIAKRHAAEVAETIARQQAGAVAEKFAQSSKSGSGMMYLLAGGAALLGIASSAVVFFLLKTNVV